MKIFIGAKYTLVSPSKNLVPAEVFGHFTSNGRGEFILFRITDGKNGSPDRPHPTDFTVCGCKDAAEHQRILGEMVLGKTKNSKVRRTRRKK